MNKNDLILSFTNTPYLGSRNWKGTFNGQPLKWLIEHIDDETDECIIWPYHKVAPSSPIITIDGKRVRITRLILEYRYGEDFNENNEACHGPCHNPNCINYRHLYWGTHQINMRDRIRDKTNIGPHLCGEENGFSKLKEDDIIEIRRAYQTGIYTQTELARMFDISQSNINDIIWKKIWRHI